jgi:uncharacterized membrane protein
LEANVNRLLRRFFGRDTALVLVLVVVCAGLLQLPTGYEERLPEHSRLSKARVIEVDNSEVQQHQILKTGTQTLKVELLGGEFEGQVVAAVNLLQGKMEIDEVYRVGQIGRAHV